MALIENEYRGLGLPDLWDGPPMFPSVDAPVVAGVLRHCPAAQETPLQRTGGLARAAGVDAVWLKDETARMGLGSFKALGAAYAIAHEAQAAGGDPATALQGRVYIAASAGNHGLSVAAGAQIFGARAVIVLAETVPESFAERLRAKGAEVLREGAIYEDSMAAALRLARDNGWSLLSDTSWKDYLDPPFRVMEGYLQMAAECVEQMDAAPSHIFLQAGVGGLAASLAAYFRKMWRDAPRIIVVEPEFAPALLESVQAGRVVTADGPISAMGRLDCKEPSLIALTGLARDADFFMTVSEDQAAEAVRQIAAAGIGTTPSGAAGVAGCLFGDPMALGLDEHSTVLAIVSEGVE